MCWAWMVIPYINNAGQSKDRPVLLILPGTSWCFVERRVARCCCLPHRWPWILIVCCENIHYLSSFQRYVLRTTDIFNITFITQAIPHNQSKVLACYKAARSFLRYQYKCQVITIIRYIQTVVWIIWNRRIVLLLICLYS